MQEDDTPQGQPTKAQLIKERREKKKEASKTAKKARLALMAQYRELEEHPAFVDLRAKIAGFDAYHMRLAKDGVGYQPTGRVLENGDNEMKEVRLTPDQRGGHLDNAAGISEISDYIARMLKLETSTDEE